MKIVILGGKGMLGSDLADACAAKKIQTLILDRDEVDIVSETSVAAQLDAVRRDAVATRHNYANADEVAALHEKIDAFEVAERMREAHPFGSPGECAVCQESIRDPFGSALAVAGSYFFRNLANSSRSSFIASAFCSAVISFSSETRFVLASLNPRDPAMLHHA